MLKLKSLFALTLAGALIFGACGGDDDDSGSNGNKNEAPQGPAASDATKADASQPTKAANEPTKAAASPTAEDAGSIFDKLTTDATKKTYMADYDIEMTNQGQVQKGTATIASKPPKQAMKISFSAGDIKGSFSFITDGKDTYTCSDFGIGGTCTKSEGVDDALTKGIDVQKALKEARSNSDIKELDKRTIAGRASRCFEAKDKTDNSVTTFCLDEKDSIMTYAELEGTSKLTATKISNNVDDKAFDLPFPVK